LRAAPKNRFGGYRAVESTPPDRIRPEVGASQVVRAGQAGDAVEDHHDVGAELDEPLGRSMAELGDHGVLLGRTVERAGHHFAPQDVASQCR